MFRKITFLFVTVLAMAHLGYAQSPNWAVISGELQERMEADPSQKISILISLSNQLDMVAKNQELYARKVTLEERSYEVITSLKANAAATQGPLLTLLNDLEGVNNKSIQSFWISNTIALEANAKAIEQLSRRADIGYIAFDEPIFLVSYNEEACAPPVSPNGREPGHSAIKANKLWEMGYTGYGTSSMVVDTGTDPDHQALRGNYKGLYVPTEQAYTGIGDEPLDCDSHGTHVTGTVCGIDRLNRDTIGVAFNATWISSPAIDCGSQNTTRGVIEIYEFAVDPDENPMTVSDQPISINNSWGSPNGQTCNPVFINTFNSVEAAGVAIVFAAGNEGPGPASLRTPMQIATNEVNSFAVGSVDDISLVISGFSSRGPGACGPSGSLEIKPEVVAPGSPIRSSVPGGGYANFSGTSMASPHVAGALCLLKEAFPNQTGEQLKYALYNTARDLGTPGEDNTYGNGIIDLVEAFNYLVAEGNTPTDPTIETDAVLVEFEGEFTICGAEIGGEITIENGGTNNLTSVDIQYELISDGAVQYTVTEPWTGNLATGERTTVALPAKIGPSGSFQYFITLLNPNGGTDDRPLNNRRRDVVLLSQQEPLEIGVFGDADPCAGTGAILIIEDEGVSNVEWYVQPNGGSPVGEGLYFETPALPAPFVFYVDALLLSSGGILDKDATDTELSDDSEGLVFDVYSDVFLKSSKFYVETPGPRLVNIKADAGNTIVQRAITVTTPGEQVIEWNIDLPAGNNYTMSLSAGGEATLTTNPSYPYDIGGVMSIKTSTNFDNPNDIYYYFYDWNIEHVSICGRQAITVNFTPTGETPTAAFEASTSPVLVNEPVEFFNNSENGASYLWNFGDGTTSDLENPTHTFTEVGTYLVGLTTINSEGCSDTEIIEIEVLLSTSNPFINLENKISVFPNPTADKLNISFDFAATQRVSFFISDVLGRSVGEVNTQSYLNENIELDLTNYTNGIYYVIFNIGEEKVVKRVVKLN